MSFGDTAARIGAIQGTLAAVSAAAAPAATTGTAVPATAAAAALAQSGSGTPGSGILGTGSVASGTLGASAPGDFTRLLQDALAPAGTAPADTRGTAGGVAAAPRPDGGTGSGTVKKVENAPVAGDGKTDGGDVVREARKYLGVPYVWGGNNPDIGLDCSSFVQHTFRDLGIKLPRVARDQAKEGTEVPSLAQARPGDLIVTRGGGHIGIYLGGNKMIHAPRPGESVSIRKLFETDADIMTIRRIVPAESATRAAAATVSGSTLRESAAQVAGYTASAQRAAFDSVVNAA